MKDQFTLFSKITENTKLVAFCNRVIGYNNILMFEESRKIFIDSLRPEHISNSNDIKEVFDIIWFISSTLKLMILEDELIKEIRDTLDIISEDIIKKFPKETQEVSNCVGA